MSDKIMGLSPKGRKSIIMRSAADGSIPVPEGVFDTAEQAINVAKRLNDQPDVPVGTSWYVQWADSMVEVKPREILRVTLDFELTGYKRGAWAEPLGRTYPFSSNGEVAFKHLIADKHAGCFGKCIRAVGKVVPEVRDDA
ncbi:MAG: hypothetical protein ACYTG7_23075 [Planctomycetota bacterium]|jgi:hypothetical protein